VEFDDRYCVKELVSLCSFFGRIAPRAPCKCVSLPLPIGSFLFLISGSRAVYYYVNCYQATIIKLIVSRTTTAQKPIRSAEFLDPPNSRYFPPPPFFLSRSSHHRRKINSLDKRAFSSARLDFMSVSVVFRRAPGDSVSSVFTPRSLVRFPNGRNSHHYVNYPRDLRRAGKYPCAVIAIIKLIGLNTRWITPFSVREGRRKLHLITWHLRTLRRTMMRAKGSLERYLAMQETRHVNEKQVERGSIFINNLLRVFLYTVLEETFRYFGRHRVETGSSVYRNVTKTVRKNLFLVDRYSKRCSIFQIQ